MRNGILKIDFTLSFFSLLLRFAHTPVRMLVVIAFRANVQGLYVYELMRNGNLTTLDKHLYEEEEEVDQKKCLRKHY